MLDVVPIGLSVAHEAQDGDEGDGRRVEGDEPDAEDLVHGDVEVEGRFVVGCKCTSGVSIWAINE